uniref:C2H2-type domain-containing protein n=1 Tax=Plectus sambesii TaxID=2011161 RepID=A0A914W9W6_9BILA
MASQSGSVTTKNLFSNSEELKCAKCGEWAKSAEALQRHVAARHLDWTPWHCPHCNVHASIEPLMIQHLRNSHPALEHWIKYCPNPNNALLLDSTISRSMRLSVKASSRAKAHQSSAVEACTNTPTLSPERSSQDTSSKNLSRVRCKVCHQSVLPNNTTAHVASEHLHQPLFLCSETECSKRRYFGFDSVKLHAEKVHGRVDVIRESGLASPSQLRSWWKRCFADSGVSRLDCHHCDIIEHTSTVHNLGNPSHLRSASFHCPQCKQSSKSSENAHRRDAIRSVSDEGAFHRLNADCTPLSNGDHIGAQSDNTVIAAGRKRGLSERTMAGEAGGCKSNAKKEKMMSQSRLALKDLLNPLDCGVCGEVCTNRVDFDEHVLQAHWRLPLYRCPFCSFCTKLLDQARRHVHFAHSDRDYQEPHDLDENQQALQQYLQTLLC